MKTIKSTHGKMTKSGGRWQVQCRYADGMEGVVSAKTLPQLRSRLRNRGLNDNQISQLEAAIDD